ncbi:MAG: hypothetical protein ACTS4U_01600, partial [Candidatus Hodgkinia cicadicola]
MLAPNPNVPEGKLPNVYLLRDVGLVRHSFRVSSETFLNLEARFPLPSAAFGCQSTAEGWKRGKLPLAERLSAKVAPLSTSRNLQFQLRRNPSSTKRVPPFNQPNSSNRFREVPKHLARRNRFINKFLRPFQPPHDRLTEQNAERTAEV